MTEDERQAYIRRVVDGAPLLSAEDASRVRSLIPLRSRVAVERVVAPRRRKAARTAAA